MTGIEAIPYRIPEEWDPKWFLEFIRDVLSLLDVRNADGVGITISGEPSTIATLSSDAIGESYVVLAASTNLTDERILAVETNVLTITDNGAGLTIVIGVDANGITFAKIQQISANRILGAIGAGDVAELTGTQATTLLDLATTGLKGVVKQTVAVTDLSQTISSPPTQAEVQAISDKIDEWLGKSRTSEQLA